jgi:hypothetical protein
MMSDTLANTLETLIDKHGLAAVLSAMSEVCAEKAEHIRSNWQDRATAKPWDEVSNTFDDLQGRAMRLGLYA